MNRVKNNKSRFKILLLTLVAALISGAALQSSFAMKSTGNLNNSKVEKSEEKSGASSNNASTTLNI